MARIANDNPTEERQEADDNIVQPFELLESNLRGRLVRLGSVVDNILSAHNYPDPVSHVLAEAMGLGLILASMLKYEGIFTLQTSTDGPIKTMVVDITSEGILRSYAAFNEDAIAEIEAATPPSSGTDENDQKARYSGLNYNSLVGEGYLAFTVDQGPETDRYQGIVSIEGQSLSQSVQHYFDQSEQIQTYVRVAAGRSGEHNKWRCGSIMIQKLPDDEKNPDAQDLDAQNIVPLSEDPIEKTKFEQSEDWNRSVTLMQTCTQEEFLAPDLHSSDLLVRLFHEEGIRIFEQKSIEKGCRCSREKVENVLFTLSPEEREDCLIDGKIDMTCEFCSQTYIFTKEELTSLNNKESQ